MSAHPQDQTEQRLPCLRCGYDVRFLPQSRCPECGLEFAWDEVRAAAEQRAHGPLFEYEWRTRPIRSFLTTVGKALAPWWLWRRTTLAIPPRAGPLLFLAALVLVLYSLIQFGLYLTWHTFWATRTGELVSAVRSFPYRACWSGLWPETVFVASMGLAVWLAAQVLRQTLRRTRVRPAHVLRVVVLAWVGMLAARLILPVGLEGGRMVRWCLAHRDDVLPQPYWMAISTLPLVLFVVSLWLGFARYLRLPRALADALLTLILAFSLMAAVWFALAIVVFRSFDNGVGGVVGSTWPGPGALLEQVLSALLRWFSSR